MEQCALTDDAWLLGNLKSVFRKFVTYFEKYHDTVFITITQKEK